MINATRMNLFDLTKGISSVVDLMSPAVSDHHIRVAYIAYNIADEMGLSLDEKKSIVLAATLHDIGAFSLETRADILNFEIEHPHQHAKVGYWLLNLFQPFRDIADIVKFHHVPWEHGKGVEFEGD
ncbi:HD-GYP domain-containing protein, partial [Candidatus Hydrogenedentota bacterium]